MQTLDAVFLLDLRFIFEPPTEVGGESRAFLCFPPPGLERVLQLTVCTQKSYAPAFPTKGLQGAIAMERRHYPSDLTDVQWQIVQTLVPPPSAVGAPQKIERREIINGILYVNRTGCQWRAMPHDLPKWQTVYGVYRQWLLHGIWQKMNDLLREEI